MGAGLFTNDLFNGEALSGPRALSQRGVFRSNLFDAQPLGQTTPAEDAAFSTMISELATTGGRTTATTGTAATTTGSKTAGTTATSTGGKTGGAASTGAKTGGAAPATMLPTESVQGEEFPWLPVALVGGGLVLTVGAILLFSGKKAPTANKRRRHR